MTDPLDDPFSEILCRGLGLGSNVYWFRPHILHVIRMADMDDGKLAHYARGNSRVHKLAWMTPPAG
jgi:hypothetical protein